MKPRAVLVCRVNDGTPRFPFLPVEIKKQAISFPVFKRSRGQIIATFEPDKVIGFYCRYPDDGRRRVEPLGKDPIAAYSQYLQIEQDFSRKQLGLLPVNKPRVPKVSKSSRNIRNCAAEFKAEMVTRRLRPRTIESYSASIENFLASYLKGSIDEVDRKDILRFLDWMRQNLDKRKFGQQSNTYRNRLKDVTVFFNRFGVKMPLAKKEWPKATKRNPDKYRLETINRMLDVADEDEKDLIQFFLSTGFRDEEAAYCKYSDFNFHDGSINAHDKPEFDWSVKDHEQRSQDIVLRSKFLKRMRARRTRHKAADGLIFPNAAGKPNMHLIRIVQRVAKRAGITERIGLHKFRRSFGTMVAKHYGLQQARIWLGHSDISTTQKYLAAEELTTEQSRKAVNAMFSGVGD